MERVTQSSFTPENTFVKRLRLKDSLTLENFNKAETETELDQISQVPQPIGVLVVLVLVFVTDI